MLKDKDMAGDTLEMLKHCCEDLTKSSIECSNSQLRSALTQMRNTAEQTQMQFSQTVIQKGWYLPSPTADQTEITKIRSFYQSGGSPVGAGVGSFTATTVNDRMS